MLQVHVPVIDKRACKDVFRRIHLLRTDAQFDDKVICAGIRGGESGCKGDSGGPLILQMNENGKSSASASSPFYQIGVVSTHKTY